MKIVHISQTAIAGAPIRLVSLLRRHTDHVVRLINLRRSPIFEHDLVYSESKDEADSLIESADILQIHNHMVLEQFLPFSAQDLRRKNIKIENNPVLPDSSVQAFLGRFDP